MSVVVDGYDAALFDLDGVVYLGPDPVPGAAEGISALRSRATAVGFVTNNAARSPEVVAGHLRRLGIDAAPADIVTSAQAVATLMASHLAPGAGVLVVGTDALADEVRAAGLVPVADADALPSAVVLGFDPAMTWDQLNEAAYAVQRGAAWYGCNPDRTRPTDRGLAIGMGTVLDALGEVLPRQRPILAGKPHRPLLDETMRRLRCRRPVFVGDRLDTDIEGACAVGMDSMFVLSGSHGAADLLAAPPHQRPTYLARDLGGLLLAPVVADPGLVGVAEGELRVTTTRLTETARLALLWTAAGLAWQAADDARPLGVGEVLDALGRLG